MEYEAAGHMTPSQEAEMNAGPSLPHLCSVLDPSPWDAGCCCHILGGPSDFITPLRKHPHTHAQGFIS